MYTGWFVAIESRFIAYVFRTFGTCIIFTRVYTVKMYEQSQVLTSEIAEISERDIFGTVGSTYIWILLSGCWIRLSRNGTRQLET